MKKIINGKKYDTETAKLVGEWDNGMPVNDFGYFEESLYRKRTGEYFLYGEGGAMSKYAESCGQNTWSGGESIIPLTYANARKWAEENLTADEYEAEFGEVSEGNSDEEVVISARITNAAKAKLDRLAAQTGRSRGDLLAEAIKKYAEDAS